MVSVPAKKVEGWALPEMPGKEYERFIWSDFAKTGPGGHSTKFCTGRLRTEV